jgi:hypothetical protein
MVDRLASQRPTRTRPRASGPKRVASLAMLLVATAGCAVASQSPSPTEAASSTPPAVATASPSSAPVATAPPASASAAAPSPLALCAKGHTPCDLTAGTYSTAPFVKPFLVTVGPGWANDRAWPHGGEIANAGRVYLEWGSGFTSVPGSSASDLVGYIQSFKGFKVSPPVPVTIGGVTGVSVDVSTNSTEARAFLTIPEDAYNLGPGEKVRFIVVDADGSPVMIMVEVPKADDFDDEISAIQPVLDSIVWQ